MSQTVVDTSKSPYALLRPVPLNAIQLTDTFWAPRLKVNREKTIPSQLRHCEETARIDNFRVASGKKKGKFEGIYFNDSDVYKWAEAASWSLATHPEAKLDAALDNVIAEIAAAQQPDGYLNTYFMFEREKERYTNLKDMHELYCAGHLIQAAVAHHRATGKTTFLNVATRLADHLYVQFGPEGRVGACGHEEAEMALVELYRDTGEGKYLALAVRMIEARGQEPRVLGGSNYHQDHKPFTQLTEVTGHAVRMLYYTAGAADAFAETGDGDYWKALEALWQNFTERRMYVTGGAGSRYEGEAFGEDFELPNDRAYTETCAAIASVMWNWRMLQITGDARYTDLIETTLYNAVLPGLSLDGSHYFYQNPLADRGKHRRQEWFGCACCPPNVARLLASLPGYFYSLAEDGVMVHLYAAGSAAIPLPEGGTLRLSQKTNYPWNGDIEITIQETAPFASVLYLRVPYWAEGATLSVNGKSIEIEEPGYYVEVPQPRAGDVIRLSLPVETEFVESHPRVLANWGRIAIRRGALIYCLEAADNPGADVWDIVLPDEMTLTPEYRSDLLGGVTVLTGEALALPSPEVGPLYGAFDTQPQEVNITAIPYYAWANRVAGPMQVWMPVVASEF